MDLTKHRDALTDALVHAYQTPAELSRMVSSDFEESLDALVAPGPLRVRAFELITWAEASGRLGELYSRALQRKPGNPRLLQLQSRLAADSKAPHEQVLVNLPPAPVTTGKDREADAAALEHWSLMVSRVASALPSSTDCLEALSWGALGLATGEDVLQWNRGMARSQKHVCRIQSGTLRGTGFLVGPRHVMTSARVIPTDDLTEDHTVVFDFIRADTVVSRLPSITIESVLHRSGEKELDYVIVKLSETPSGDRGFAEAWQHHFSPKEPVHVLQHGGGRAMHFASGIVADLNTLFNRVVYTANTESCSSGSPVFDSRWHVVALHQQGDPGFSNHGIPMEAILKDNPSLFEALW